METRECGSVIGTWILEFLWSLELGIWNFEVRFLPCPAIASAKAGVQNPRNPRQLRFKNPLCALCISAPLR
jgi:hypothetical protein